MIANSPDSLTPYKIKENIYLLYGNVGIVIGDDYVLLVDSWLGHYQKNSNQELMDAIKKITDKPVKYVINTHSHGDHSGGNKYFVEQGATVITHQNALYSPYIPKSGQPPHILRFNKQLHLGIGNERIKIEHIKAHTFDDALIFLEESNVLFVGDNLKTNGWVGLGVYGKESFEHWIDKALSLMDDKTLVIPGHGITPFNREQLISYQQSVNKWINHIMKKHQKGLSAKQISKDPTSYRLKRKFILDEIDEQSFNLSYQEYDAEQVSEIIELEVKPSIQLKESQLMDYVGSYYFEDKNNIDILVDNGKLLAKQRDKFFSYLLPISKDTFKMTTTNGDEVLKFHRDSNSAQEISGLTPIIPKHSHYRSLITGRWHKIVKD